MPGTSQKRDFDYFDSRIHRLGVYLRHVSLPGFQKVSVYTALRFFYSGMSKGSLNTRASSISFNFMLAIGPGVIFLFALMPYLPFPDLKQELLEVLNDIIPADSYIAMESLLKEVFQKRGGGLPLFGFVLSIFFTQKGINGMIQAFNSSYHTLIIRSWYKQRMVVLGLVFIFYGLVLVAALSMFITRSLLKDLFEGGYIKLNSTYYLMIYGKWIIVVILTFCCISFLYYFAPMRRTNWRFFSAGSILATILTVAASLGFSYFVNHFAPFNKFYGSIGVLIALMLWFNFNALTLLIGFELNASINKANPDTGEH